MEGMNDIQQNIEALRMRLLAAAGSAADESGMLLSSYAKSIAPWTDRSKFLRGSIKGQGEVSADVATVVVSESMTYAPFVEGGTRRARPYPSLWPSVAANVDNVMGIFSRHMKL